MQSIKFQEQEQSDNVPTKSFEITELASLLSRHAEQGTYCNQLFFIQGAVRFDKSEKSKQNTTCYISGCYFVPPKGTSLGENPIKFSLSTGLQKVRALRPKYNKGSAILFIKSQVDEQDIIDKVVTEQTRNIVNRHSLDFGNVMPKIIQDLTISAREVVSYINFKKKNLNIADNIKVPCLEKNDSVAYITHPVYEYLAGESAIKIVTPKIIDKRTQFVPYATKEDIHQKIYPGSRASTNFFFELTISKLHGARINISSKHRIIVIPAPYRDIDFTDKDYEMFSPFAVEDSKSEAGSENDIILFR
jgi:hypothetical protein